jgi:probable DNA repair protein
MSETLPAISDDELLTKQPERTLVLAVNNRHARRLFSAMSARLSAQRSVMAVPRILPLSAWLAMADDELAFTAHADVASHRLDTFGAQHIWQELIQRIESDNVLLDVGQAAKLAAQADLLLDEWMIHVDPESHTDDSRRFAIWRTHYRRWLEENDAQDANLAYERLLRAVRDGRYQAAVDTIVLSGFHELSPRFSDLLAALRDRGIHSCVLRRTAPSVAVCQGVTAPDPDSEWRMAALWAARKLSERPEGTYAIITPRLQADVALAHRVLRDALDGQPYNIAVARPLAHWPQVRAMHAWLHVLGRMAQRGYCDTVDMGLALNDAAFLVGPEQQSAMAAMDVVLRRKAYLSVSLKLAQDLFTQYVPAFAVRWQASLELLTQAPTRDAIGKWVSAWRICLQQLGFPGPGVLSSHAYQVMESFDATLDTLRNQDVVLGKLPYAAALTHLNRVLRDTAFQPQRDPQARLDVLGLLESEGGQWDAAWVLGLTDEVLPATPKPNPFIPSSVLRAAGAPRATPERELQWARTMFEALQACAPELYLSWASHEGERELRPSPFIAELPLTQDRFEREPLKPARLESVKDEQGPALVQGQVTRGGIGVIDTQARNPLWAFVKYRLGASLLPAYAQPFDQNVRGMFLHRAAELFWNMVPDQDRLQELCQAGGLDALVTQCVQVAAQELLVEHGQALRMLEIARAESVLHAWLWRELAREPFSIRGVEQEFAWRHGPLELSVRLDRIDELGDGRLAVIDYKAGNGAIEPRSNWMRERPVGLQLPFYAAVLADEDPGVSVLALVRLHARKIEYKGLGDGDYGFEGLAQLAQWPAFAGYAWQDLLGHWRAGIQGLADEFAAGMARNHSLRADDVQYCDVLPFLRLNEEAPHVG